MPIPISLIDGGKMHCPHCLQNSLNLSSRGVIHIYVNHLQMDAGRFLFNTEKDTDQQIAEQFKLKLEEFFEWYSEFKNKEPIRMMELVSMDFTCSNKCKFEPGTRFSVLGVLIEYHDALKILKETAKKYDFSVMLYS